jgi:hypothetical protein
MQCRCQLLKQWLINQNTMITGSYQGPTSNFFLASGNNNSDCGDILHQGMANLIHRVEDSVAFFFSGE